jgi:hypothetical protein
MALFLSPVLPWVPSVPLLTITRPPPIGVKSRRLGRPPAIDTAGTTRPEIVEALERAASIDAKPTPALRLSSEGDGPLPLASFPVGPIRALADNNQAAADRHEVEALEPADAIDAAAGNQARACRGLGLETAAGAEAFERRGWPSSSRQFSRGSHPCPCWQ